MIFTARQYKKRIKTRFNYFKFFWFLIVLLAVIGGLGYYIYRKYYFLYLKPATYISNDDTLVGERYLLVSTNSDNMVIEALCILSIMPNVIKEDSSATFRGRYICFDLDSYWELDTRNVKLKYLLREILVVEHGDYKDFVGTIEEYTKIRLNNTLIAFDGCLQKILGENCQNLNNTCFLSNTHLWGLDTCFSSAIGNISINDIVTLKKTLNEDTDLQKIEDISMLIKNDLVRKEQLQVEIYNATETNGWAGVLSDWLTAESVNVIRVRNAPSRHKGMVGTHIYIPSGVYDDIQNTLVVIQNSLKKMGYQNNEITITYDSPDFVYASDIIIILGSKEE